MKRGNPMEGYQPRKASISAFGQAVGRVFLEAKNNTRRSVPSVPPIRDTHSLLSSAGAVDRSPLGLMMTRLRGPTHIPAWRSIAIFPSRRHISHDRFFRQMKHSITHPRYVVIMRLIYTRRSLHLIHGLYPDNPTSRHVKIRQGYPLSTVRSA
jgi:hypothetical protein